MNKLIFPPTLCLHIKTTSNFVFASLSGKVSLLIFVREVMFAALRMAIYKI